MLWSSHQLNPVQDPISQENELQLSAKMRVGNKITNLLTEMICDLHFSLTENADISSGN